MEIYENLDLNDLEGEEWRNVVGYENYQVSNMGRVKSLGNNKTRKDKILRQTKFKNGYLIVNLCKEGKYKTCYVHRLVGNAFLENPNNYPYYNHKNEIKTDNRAVNLEPCDHQYNNTYGSRMAKVAEKLSRQVYQYDKNGELVAIWQSVMECDRNDFIRVAVSQCCRNCYMREGNNVYKNYIWSYTPIDSK